VHAQILLSADGIFVSNIWKEEQDDEAGKDPFVRWLFTLLLNRSCERKCHMKASTQDAGASTVPLALPQADDCFSTKARKYLRSDHGRE
jgi:hypothetical protein